MAKRIADEVRVAFAAVLAHPKWAGAAVPAVHEEACRRLVKEGHDKAQLPTLPWSYKFVSDHRTNLTPRDRWLDSLFSIGSLSDPSFPSDPATVEFLGMLLRRSIVGGATLTNRRAIWAARLAHFFPASVKHFWRFYWAFFWAKQYADSELSHSLIGEPLSTESLDHELLFVEWPGNISGNEATSGVARLLVKTGLRSSDVTKERPGFRKRLREKLEQLGQGHLMPTIWDDVIDERYLHLVDLLSGVHGNPSWDESLSAAEYDTTFLALRTVVDRDNDRWSGMKLDGQLSIANQLAIAVRSNDTDTVKELIGENVGSKEVEA